MRPTLQLSSCLLAVFCWLFPSPTAGQAVEGLRVPDGFEVTLYAGDSLVHDIHSMTIDSLGRVAVAGPNYVKLLEDEDRDGRADTARLFSEVPRSGAHGMLFVGADLICTGDNALMRLRDDDRDGQADGAPQVWTQLKHSEHGANGLVHGPDGWIYLICGNDAGVGPEHVTTASSPVRDPECGAVLRMQTDGARSEVYAHGFRNPYDLAFSRYGHLLTVDSDGERDHHLPWYSPTRVFDVGQGRHHGWVLKGWQRSWNRPEWFPDNVQRLAELGRGSPTGVEVYRHTQFPARYREGLFSCCWTLGRVYYLPLQREGASLATEPEVFLETTGTVGFAPVDLAVGPEGDLFVAIGGRHTQGGVFRIRYAAGQPERIDPEDPVAAVLRAPQPLAAWSRAQWTRLADSLGQRVFEHALVSPEWKVAEKMRAVEVLTERFKGLSPELALRVASQGDAELTARVAWSLGRAPQGAAAVDLLAKLTSHRDPRVERAAWESLADLPADAWKHAAADWNDLYDRAQQRKRWAALVAHSQHGEDNRLEIADTLTEMWQNLLRDGPRGGEVEMAVEIFEASSQPEERLEAIRLMQIALGDIVAGSDDASIFAGYALAGPERLREAAAERHGWQLAAAFPTGNRFVDLELARLLGMLHVGDADLKARMSQMMWPQSPLLDDLHYLIVLAMLPGRRDVATTQRVAQAIAGLHGKLKAEGRQASRNWPIRVQEIFQLLQQQDPRLPVELVEQPAFALAEQSLFVLAMPPEVQPLAARRLLEALLEEGSTASWTARTVEMVGLLPAEEALPILRTIWDDPFLRDAASEQLARWPHEEDRSRLLSALASPQPHVVEQAAAALKDLASPVGSDEYIPVLRALKHASRSSEMAAVRDALNELLIRWTGSGMDAAVPGDSAGVEATWSNWFAATYPEEVAALSAGGTAGFQQWRSRLENINWDSGRIEAGRLLFAQKACHRCHEGQSRLGPDLRGAATRFAPVDLFLAIVDPSRDVAPSYQTTQIVTGQGRVFHGLVVYESPDGTLLQTAADSTIRIAGQEIVAMRPSTQSLMPTGLLDGLEDQDLADLYSYLRTLSNP